MVVGKERRRAYRIYVPELRVRVAGYEYDFKAWDLSILGIGFMYGANPFRLAQILRMDLLEHSGIILSGVDAIVSRMGAGVVGCAFLRLQASQQSAVEALVLRMQAERIAQTGA
ncbi:PilZ domain-containing protein [Desulfocurvibacter africanus]|uniref:PilZ domain-containing protein n=1 Tax=Desulfocurvibacter africanus TaxID=873 RepID=UPI0004294D7D|nr:PilZ domain-containing protein [Desulfocurvibacter africanus]